MVDRFVCESRTLLLNEGLVICDKTVSQLPRCIPRVEPTVSHREFVEAVEPAAVMIGMVGARRLMKRGETVNSYFPRDTAVIVTSTIRDEKLRLISWERELEIVKAVKADFHVPTDYWVYRDQDETARRENTLDCMRGTAWMEERHDDVEIIPLIKGISPDEREICYRFGQEFDAEYTAFYTAQYFTNGNRFGRVREIVEEIGSVTGDDLLLIGLLSPDYLDQLHDCVAAAAGKYQWRDRITPAKQSNEQMRAAYDELATSVQETLQNNGTG